MSEKSSPPAPKSPTDIARETFKRLALDRIAPTPEAYRKLYVEISGIDDTPPVKVEVPQPRSIDDILPNEAENLLGNFAKSLQKSSGDLADFGHRFTRALKGKDWEDYAKGLNELASKVTTRPNNGNLVDTIAPLPATVNALPKRISLVDDEPEENARENLLKDLLFRTLSMAVTSLLKPNPVLATESESIADAVKVAVNEAELNSIGGRLKQLCFQIELKSGDTAEQQELLLRLFSLLLENVRELLDDDNWLRGQIEVVQNLIAGPIDHRALQEATRSLKDVIYKQGALKHSLAESKTSVKNMMAAFIDRLDVMTSTTTNYQEKISGFSKEISNTRNAE